MHEPRPVSAIRVVVDREQIPEIVEGKLLRVPQACCEDLKLGAIGQAAKDCPPAGFGRHATGMLDLVAPVADREIESAIRPEHEAVEIVAAKGHPTAIAL